MKSESLVIVNQNVTMNVISNFAHTAHHTRRVVLSRSLAECLVHILLIVIYIDDTYTVGE